MLTPLSHPVLKNHELLSLFFDYLSGEDLSRASRVCRVWHHAAQAMPYRIERLQARFLSLNIPERPFALPPSITHVLFESVRRPKQRRALEELVIQAASPLLSYSDSNAVSSFLHDYGDREVFTRSLVSSCQTSSTYPSQTARLAFLHWKRGDGAFADVLMQTVQAEESRVRTDYFLERAKARLSWAAPLGGPQAALREIGPLNIPTASERKRALLVLLQDGRMIDEVWNQRVVFLQDTPALLTLINVLRNHMDDVRAQNLLEVLKVLPNNEDYLGEIARLEMCFGEIDSAKTFINRIPGINERYSAWLKLASEDPTDSEAIDMLPVILAHIKAKMLEGDEDELEVTIDLAEQYIEVCYYIHNDSQKIGELLDCRGPVDFKDDLRVILADFELVNLKFQEAYELAEKIEGPNKKADVFARMLCKRDFTDAIAESLMEDDMYDGELTGIKRFISEKLNPLVINYSEVHDRVAYAYAERSDFEKAFFHVSRSRQKRTAMRVFSLWAERVLGLPPESA